MTKTWWTLGTAGWLVMLAVAAGQGVSPSAQARAEAFFQALATGSPGTYEAMAREQFAPSLLARRTAEERKAMVERIRADFGALTPGPVRSGPGGTVEMVIRGATPAATSTSGR